MQYANRNIRFDTKSTHTKKKPLLVPHIKQIREICSSLHLISLHYNAANAPVVPQHAGIVEVETVLQEKLAVIERERAMAPKVNVGQILEKLCEQSISLVHIRVEVLFPLGNEQARDDATDKNVSHAGNARYATREIDDRHYGSFGGRTAAAEVVRPEVEDHAVWA